MQAAAGKAVSKLEAIQEAVKAVGPAAAEELLALPCAPALTWSVVRALLLVLGQPPAAVDTWLKCRSCSGCPPCLPFIRSVLLAGLPAVGPVRQKCAHVRRE